MRPNGSAAELESRRRLAGKLLLEGKTVGWVAETLGVTCTSVRRWQAALQRGGQEALAAKPHPGKPSRLSSKQKLKLEKLLLKGPLKAGFATDLWTCPRVAQLIQREFGVKYHEAHVWKILQRLNWSCQKPERRAREQNREAVDRWRKEDWPRIKKRASTSMLASSL